MKTFCSYIESSFSNIFIPSNKDIENKIDFLCTNNNIHIQLLEYRKLEFRYSSFYKDQLAARTQEIINSVWDNRKEMLKYADNKEIIEFLSEIKIQYNKIIYFLYKQRFSLYKNLTIETINKNHLSAMLNNTIKIIYFTQLKKCIDQITHKFIAILYT